MLKEIQNEKYSKCFVGKIDIFKAQMVISKSSIEDNSRKLKALLFNNDYIFITVTIEKNKGKVVINDAAFIKLFNFLSYEHIKNDIQEFIDEIGSLIVKNYNYNIANKNFFWNEMNNIPNKIENIFFLSKDNRSLLYSWNSLTPKEQNEFLRDTANEFLNNGVFNISDACIYINKFDIINLLKNNPKVIISYLRNAKIIKNEEDEIQYSVLTDIANKIINLMV